MSLQLLKSSSLVGLMTFISRILGLIRDMILAHYFGATAAYDAFLMAFKIPNFMRRLFAEGAFSQAFVPVLMEYRVQRSQTEVQLLLNRVFGCLTLVLSTITAMGICASPWVVLIFAPGFAEDPQRWLLASNLLRLTFPYLLFISLTALIGGILNAYGRFAMAAFTPVLLNIAMISAALLLAPQLQQPIEALAWGVLAAGLLQFVFLWPFLKTIGIHLKWQPSWADSGVRRILTLMVPALLGVSVNQLNLLVDSAFASFLRAGSVSWLYYADRLMEFPLGIFGVALATVVLPNLSKQVAKRQEQAFSATLDWGLRAVLLIGVPAAIGLGFLARPLIATLFYSPQGKFSALDLEMSAKALQPYALGLLGFMLVKVLASAYYARQNIKTPVKIAMATMIANIALNASLVGSFAHAGLALATSIAALMNSVLLYIGLRRLKYYSHTPGWSLFILRLSLAALSLAAFLYCCVPGLDFWLQNSVIAKVGALLLWVGGGAIVYGAVLLALGFRPRDVWIQPI